MSEVQAFTPTGVEVTKFQARCPECKEGILEAPPLPDIYFIPKTISIAELMQKPMFAVTRENFSLLCKSCGVTVNVVTCVEVIDKKNNRSYLTKLTDL